MEWGVWAEARRFWGLKMKREQRQAAAESQGEVRLMRGALSEDRWAEERVERDKRCLTYFWEAQLEAAMCRFASFPWKGEAWA